MRADDIPPVCTDCGQYHSKHSITGLDGVRRELCESCFDSFVEAEVEEIEE
jgi:hypothetical protein